MRWPLDGYYPALGRSHEFNVGISYQDNKENLSFYEEGESMIPDLRKFDGNIAKPDMPYLRDGFTHENLSVYGSTRFKPDRQTCLYRRQPFCGLALPLQRSRNKFAQQP